MLRRRKEILSFFKLVVYIIFCTHSTLTNVEPEDDQELEDIGFGRTPSQPITENAVLGSLSFSVDANSVTATSSTNTTKEKVAPRPHVKFAGVCISILFEIM